MEQSAAGERSEMDGVVSVRPTPDQLWEQYGSAICRFASMVARNDAEAEDIAQDATLRALRGLAKFNPSKGRIEAWLWRIVQNTARDHGRAARRRAAIFARLVQFRERADEPWPDLEAQVDGRTVLEAVRGLPEQQRSLIALRFGADLPYTDVGRLTGLSPMAARAATRRALVALAARLPGGSE